MKQRILALCILPMALCTTVFTSCSDYLEEENPSGVNASTFYATESGAESGVKSCYSFLRLYYGKEQGYHFSEIGTDIFCGATGNTATEFDTYNISLSGSSSCDASVWEAFYLALNTCNELIDKLPTSALNESTRNIRLGEVHFLRALYLWQIVTNWGDVVLNTEPTQSPVTDLHRSSEEEFYKVIVEDLKFACENLPTTTSDYGRVTRGAAQAMMSRVSLYTEDWASVIKYSDMVLADKNYQLAEDYNQLVDVTTCNSVKENIFVCNYASQSNNNYNSSITYGPNGKDMTIRNGGNNAHMFWTMLYDKCTDRDGKTPVSRCIEYGRPFNRFMPTLFYLDLFNEKIDSRYDDLFQQAWISNNNNSSYIKSGDTAIVFTKYKVDEAVKSTAPYIIVDRSRVYADDGTPIDRSWNTTFLKFADPTRGATNDQHSGRDAVIIRLAEVYLNAAEAYFRQGDRKKAADMLNVVRCRAAKPGCEEQMKCSENDVTIDFILDERARELGGEQLRWQDLKRTGKLVERVNAHNMLAHGNVQQYHLLRPIPLTTLDGVTNPDEFKQNPGYTN